MCNVQGNLKTIDKFNKNHSLASTFNNYRAEHWNQDIFEWGAYMRKRMKFHLCSGKSPMETI
jgi:hypothetical protein